MNKSIRLFAETRILELLPLCTDKQRELFALMYGRKNGKRPIEESVLMPMSDIVSEIPDDKISWALTQIENTLNKATE
jgi:hypothetical protein